MAGGAGSAGKDPIALSCRCLTSEDGTSSTYRGMHVSPVHRALLATAAVSSPAPPWPTCSGLRLLSRTLGLSTLHEGMQMAYLWTVSLYHQQHLSGMWEELQVAIPGCSCLFPRRLSTEEGAVGPVPWGLFHQQLNCLLFKHPPRDESLDSQGRQTPTSCLDPGVGALSECPPPSRLQGDHARISPWAHRLVCQVYQLELRETRTQQGPQALTPPCSLILSCDYF